LDHNSFSDLQDCWP